MDATSADVVVDSISIKELQERYSLSSRQAVYNRLEKLGIKPERGIINSEQLAQMDKLHQEQQDPKKDATLTRMTNESTGQAQKSTGQLDNSQSEMLLAMFEMLAARLQQPEPSEIASLRERLELLELCAQQGNTLSTSELAEILGLKADSLRDKPQHFQYGYLFLKAGKHSHELAWSIHKHIKK